MHEAIEKVLETTFDGVYVRLNEQEGLTLVYDYGTNYSTIGYGFPYH